MAARREIRNSTAEFLIFQAEGKGQGVEVMYANETIWCTQKAMASLFDVGVPAISKHLSNVFETKELDESATVSKMEIVHTEGTREVKRPVVMYKLDAIIAVGYRVNSVRATQFRQWATSVLRDYAIRGYVLDRKRMENGAFLGEDYFEHLLAEIREIRLSERRFYQKLTDIYSTAVDYNRDAPTTHRFFQMMQNKMHYAVHGHTAAELIVERADAGREHMGLTTWENAPDGKIVKTDVPVAKNYLRETELADMGQLVNGVLELAERMARRHVPMTMEDWAVRIDTILAAGGSPVLQTAGQVSAEQAKEHAETEFEKYRVLQDRLFRSDFDRYLDALPFEDE
ncbi:MAG: virulence RhuM family protein [Bacteroidaceae bacterium]|nr:virulence RhuM family protein [Bacteroidaceae bacterium]